MTLDTSAVVTADPTTIGPLYTTAEVATMLRVNQRTVQEWIRGGHLPAVRYGRLLRIRQADLAAFGEAAPRRTGRGRRGLTASRPRGAARRQAPRTHGRNANRLMRSLE
jgi:excisionase family DNA binding protein